MNLKLLIPAFFTFSTLSSLISLHAQGIWTQKANFGAGAVTEARAFAIGTKGYFGAVTPFLWEYDPLLDTWTQKAAFTGPIRYSAVGFSIGAKGYFGTGDAYNDFYEYDQITNIWTQKANFAGSGREGAVGCAINGKGYIGLGGNYLNDWWEYDPVNDAWTQKANLGGPGRYHAGAFAIGSYGYVCTGFNGSFFNDLWEYDPAANSWTAKANLPGITRDRPVGFAIGTKGYIITGWTGGMALNDAWEWDQVTDTWTQLPSCPGAPRYNACGFTVGSKLYIGTGYANGPIDDLWEYGSNCSLQSASQPVSCNGSCDGTATVTFPDSNAVLSYLWSTGDTTQTVVGLCAGTYVVSITDTAGCSSSTAVIVTEPSAIVATATSVQPTCFGGNDGSLCSVVSGGVPPYIAYLWSNGSTTQCADSIEAGTYTVTITDTNGCTGISSVTLSQPAQMVLILQHTDATCATCTDGNATANVSGGIGPYTFNWSNGATNTAFIQNLVPGIYTCCVTDANGCIFCDSVSIGFTSSINELDISNGISVIPNPFSNYLVIESKKGFGKNDKIRLKDESGREINVQVAFEKGKIKLDTRALNDGIYFVEIHSENKRTYFKLVKIQ